MTMDDTIREIKAMIADPKTPSYARVLGLANLKCLERLIEADCAGHWERTRRLERNMSRMVGIGVGIMGVFFVLDLLFRLKG